MKTAALGIIVGPRGRGSNMLAIAAACASGSVPASVKVVIAPMPEAPSLMKASETGLPVCAIGYDPEESYGERLMAELEGVDIVCLAGYLRILPTQVLQAFPDRILNIHPALLPEFGGKGMYGMHVHRAVIAAGKTASGCTVHLVNEHYDEGRILLQRRVAIEPGETAESLAEKVLREEHIAYPEAIKQVIESQG